LVVGVVVVVVGAVVGIVVVVVGAPVGQKASFELPAPLLQKDVCYERKQGIQTCAVNEREETSPSRSAACPTDDCILRTWIELMASVLYPSQTNIDGTSKE
jgi:hypothetical protein